MASTVYFSDEESAFSYDDDEKVDLQEENCGDSEEEDELGLQQPRVYSKEIEELRRSLRCMFHHGPNDFCFPNDPTSATGQKPSEVEDVDKQDRLLNKLWCLCGCCSIQNTATENLCCTECEEIEDLLDEENVCITAHHLFFERAISKPNLEHYLHLLAGLSGRRPDVNNNRSLRYAAYRSYTAWIHGHLGRYCRIPIPSCVVTRIREAYPDPLGNYTGFKFYHDMIESNMDADNNF